MIKIYIHLTIDTVYKFSHNIFPCILNDKECNLGEKISKRNKTIGTKK